MANEFKIKKGLIVQGSGSIILDIQGSQGELFSVTDNLSGSLFSVNDISGMPILQVSSDDSVKLGTFNAEAIKVSGSVAIITGSFSGSFSGNSFVQNGNSFGATALLGTNDNQSLALETSGSTRLFISSSGNVGIGTTSPAAKLHIVNTGQFLFNTDNLQIASAGVSSFLYNNAINWSSALTFTLQRQGGTTGLHINSSDNVGIGKISPNAKLDVNGNVLVTGSLTATATITAGNTFANSVGLLLMTTSSRAQLYQAGGVDLAYFDGVGTVNGLTLRNTGFVGIGTATPTTLLHVSGTVANPIIVERSTATSNVYIQYKNATTSWYAGQTDQNTFGIGTNAALGASTVFNISSSGNVGIGTITPGNKLSIVGAASVGDDTIPALGTNGGKFAILNGGGSGFYGLLGGVLGTGQAFFQVQRTDSTATAYNLFLQPNGGGITVGTTGSIARLFVNSLPSAITGLTNVRSFANTFFGGYGGVNLDYGLSIGMTANAPIIQAVQLISSSADLGLQPYGGNVGIGTQTPSQKLDVNGSIQILNGGVIKGSVYGGTQITIDNDLTLQANRDVFIDTGVSFKANGNVGIGTLTPSSSLHIVGPDPYLVLQGNSTDYSNAGIQLIANGATSTRALGIFMYQSGSQSEWFAGNPYTSADDYMIGRKGNVISGSYLSSPPGITAQKVNSFLFISSSGNVGIGTTIPAHKLQVAGGDINIDNNRYISAFSSTGVQQAIFSLNSSNKLIFGGGGQTTAMGFDVAGGAEDMTLTTTGLGIGTTTPAYKLDVSGSGNFTSNVTVTGSLTTTGTLNAVGNIGSSGSTISLGSFGQFSNIYLAVPSDLNTPTSNGGAWVLRSNVGSSLAGYSYGFRSTNGSSTMIYTSSLGGYINFGLGTPGYTPFGAGSGNYNNLNIQYSLNGTAGVQTGTANGILLNATETTLNGMTHNLINLQVGGVSKFSVINTGAFISNANSIINGTLSTSGIVSLQNNSSIFIGGLRTYSTGNGVEIGKFNTTTNGTFTGTAGTQIGAAFFNTVSQSSTAGFTDILLNSTEVALGSGGHNLIDLQVGGVSRFKINNDGSITASGSLTASGSMVFTGDITGSNALFTGTITAQKLIVQTVTSSIIYSSGSNTFGSQLTDIQSFTGSLRVTGSGNHYVMGGRVGIGTNAPQSTLHVVGGYYGTGEVIFGNASGRLTNSGNDAYLDAVNAGSLILRTTSAEGLRINSLKNVGIGTVALGAGIQARLHVRGSGSGSASTSLLVENSNASSSLVVLDNGNVGIGTLTPAVKLDVSGSATIGLATSSFDPSNLTSKVLQVVVAPNTSAGLYVRDFNDYTKQIVVTPSNGSTSFPFIGTSLGSTRRLDLGVANIPSMTLVNGGSIGIGTISPSASLHVAGTTILSSSFNTAISGSTLKVQGSGSTQPIFTVVGSQGELFSITDSLSGSLFSVNDISGLPILEAFSDSTILMGDYQAPALYTTDKITSTVLGSNVIYSFSTSSYDGIFIDYIVKSGSNARAGNFAAIWSGTAVNYIDNSTTDFGSTAGMILSGSISGSNIVIFASGSTAGWTFKGIVKAI